MSDQRILMGVVGRPHGVRGHVHVHSYTADPAALAEFFPLCDEAGRVFRLRWIQDGIAEISVSAAGGAGGKVADRTAAEKLVNTRLYVDRAQLSPVDDEDDFYFADLVGLEAFDPSGVSMGRVIAVHDYGAGTSLEVGGKFLPFTKAVFPRVDIAAGRLTVVLPDEIEAAPSPALDHRRDYDNAASP